MKEQWCAPTLRRDAKLSKPESSYFPDGWIEMGPGDKHAAIIELCRGRCPFFGVPKANENLVVVNLNEGQLEFDSCSPAPWSYVALLSSPRGERDAAGAVRAGKWRILHYDPLDEARGFEAVNEEMRAFPHEGLDYYQRKSTTQVKAASEWLDRVGAAWVATNRGLIELMQLLFECDEYVQSLGFTSLKEMLSRMGICGPKIPGMAKLVGTDIWAATADGVSPYLVDFLFKTAGGDAVDVLPKLRTLCQFSPDGRGDTDVAAFIEWAKEEFPAEKKPQHFIIVRGNPAKEVDTSDVPELAEDGVQVTVIKGKVACKGQMEESKLL